MKKICILLLSVVAIAGCFDCFSVASQAETKVHRKSPRHQVELFVTSWCPYCNKAKAYLDSRGISYRLYDIERDQQAALRKQQLDTGRGVPFAIINGTKIRGWSQRAYETALDN